MYLGRFSNSCGRGTGGLGVWFENLTAEIWKIVKKINPCTYIIVYIVFLPFTLLKLARYFSFTSLKFPIIRVGQNYCSSPCQAGLGNTASFLEWQYAILMQRPFFFAKIIIPWKCKLGCIFANFLFSFCQKTNLHLYKCSRLSLYLFTFFWRFRIKISCHNMFQFLKLHHMIWHELIWHFFTMLNLYSSIPRNVIIACSDMYNPVWKSYFIAQLPWQRNSINK